MTTTEATNYTPLPVRERGTITAVRYGPDDRWFTCFVTVDFGVAVQGFGGLALDPERTGPAFRDALCAAFNVDALDDLVGRPCVALWKDDTLNAPIAGLEAPSGRRLVIDEWRRAMAAQGGGR